MITVVMKIVKKMTTMIMIILNGVKCLLSAVNAPLLPFGQFLIHFCALFQVISILGLLALEMIFVDPH